MKYLENVLARPWLVFEPKIKVASSVNISTYASWAPEVSEIRENDSKNCTIEASTAISGGYWLS